MTECRVGTPGLIHTLIRTVLRDLRDV